MNNTIIIRDCLEEFKNENFSNLKSEEAFERFTAFNFTKDSELSFDEIDDAIVDGSQDGGIDVFILMVNDEYIQNDDEQIRVIKQEKIQSLRLIIGQAKYQNNIEETVIDKLISSCSLFFELSVEFEVLKSRFNDKLVSKISLFHDLLKYAYRKGAEINVDFYYASTANRSDQMRPSFHSKIKQIIDLAENKITHASVNFSLLSAKELFDLYRKTKSYSVEINFKEAPVPVEYKGNQIGYIGVVKLKDYYNFLHEPGTNQLREYMFENNVRHFQGNTIYNDSIKATLLNDFLSDFWWLNNGVTIIASNVRGAGKELSMDNVQIVNGLQTSFTISKFYGDIVESQEDNRSILVKIIDNDDKETIDKIISATNRQNPVSPILLRATEEIQRRIETYFFNKGYYYDRRKNYYKNQGKSASRIFSIQTTAQAIHSIRNFEPTASAQSPTALIKNDSTYRKIFDENIDFGVYLKCCKIYQQTYNYILSLDDKDMKGFAKIFKYHITRVATALAIGKYYYGTKDLQDFNEDKSLSPSILENAIIMVFTTAKNYQTEHEIWNMPNIAKTRNFQEVLDSTLKSRLVIS